MNEIENNPLNLDFGRLGRYIPATLVSRGTTYYVPENWAYIPNPYGEGIVIAMLFLDREVVWMSDRIVDNDDYIVVDINGLHVLDRTGLRSRSPVSKETYRLYPDLFEV